VFLEQPVVIKFVKEVPALMESEGSSPYSQNIAIGACPELVEFSSQLRTFLSKISQVLYYW
jgi:hypothetical protein